MKEQVLVIDDEESIRFGLTRLLQQAGYHCVHSGDSRGRIRSLHSP